MSRVIEEHRQYLADHTRVSAFRRAITEVVKPGNVVLDLGTGTSLLGLLACEAGAEQVYSLDEGGMIGIAREICIANGFQERMIFLRGLSTRLELPKKVDVVVADQMGPFGVDAGLLEYFTDARKRFLKPAGFMIPSQLDLCIAPVEYSEMFDRIAFWNDSSSGFNLRPLQSIAVNSTYPIKLSSAHFLGQPEVLASVDLSCVPMPLKSECTFVATRNGHLHGFGGWFLARLSPSVTMSNSPLARRPINRSNSFFPIDGSVPIEKGDRIEIGMQIVPDGPIITWNVEVWGNLGPRKAKFSHSTFRGMLVSKEDLQRTQPHFIPKLSALGEARRSVVNLCDGQRTLSDIEQAVYHSHTDLFPSLDKAAEFVAETVTRYSL